MPSAGKAPGDRGLARERTALSWQRMALSFTSLAGVTLAAAAHRHRPWLLAPTTAWIAAGADDRARTTATARSAIGPRSVVRAGSPIRRRA